MSIMIIDMLEVSIHTRELELQQVVKSSVDGLDSLDVGIQTHNKPLTW